MMLKKPEFSNMFDDYGHGQAETMTDDFGGDEFEEIDDYLEEETEETAEAEENENRNIKTNREEVNQDLRLVNAYFKEVSTETLLAPNEEAHVAAKIKCCEDKATSIRKRIEKLIGKKLGQEPEKLEEAISEFYSRDIQTMMADERKKHVEVCGQLSTLASLHKVYQKKGFELRNRFIKANLRLVASMAKRFAGRGVPFLDLIQEGNLGLIKAVERFDHRKGYRFSTYACWWINQAMTRGVFNQTRTVKMPAYLLEKAGKVRHVKRELTRENEREPLPEEIAKKAEMSVENVRRILESATNKVVRLDTPIWNGEKATFLDYVEDSGALKVDSLIAEISIPGNINDALLILPIREREVVKMRFGIGYECPYTLDEIGRKFRLTRERIRQIEKKALDRIRRSKSAPVLRSLMEVYN
ncbi:MAG: sigma-70 family RNA polymerase sigma factor [Thermodesulfobacteriota bacterium]